ncbi:MAG TPA: nuclear transport factor 2 family protein [Flavitalea sp.]|nr:nuclear transport factor 2 family protein [Flavitalea sp.]
MKKTLILGSLLFSFSFLEAQSNNDIENLIRDLEAKSVKAILDGDTNTLKKMWAPEFMVNTPRNDVAQNRDAVLLIQKTGLINYSSFTRTIEKIQIQEDVVITMGYETYIPKENLPQAGQTIKRRFINVWIKKNGQWQHIARQASIICP